VLSSANKLSIFGLFFTPHMASEDFGKLRSHMELEGQRNLGKK